MQINDVVFGKVEVSESVLVSLMESSAMERIKGISQLSLPKGFSRIPWFSRYEHSVGTMLALRHLGASLEEQVAGLLHDVSHTAFSHTVDRLVGREVSQDYQEKNHQKFIDGTDIPAILQKHDIDLDLISDVKSYSLLEQKIPDICADRIDYTLREFYYWANPGIVQSCLDDFIVIDGKIVFKNRAIAAVFARTFLKLQRESWGSAYVVTRSYLFVKILQLAIEEGLVTMNDLENLNDETVINILKQSSNDFISELLLLLEQKKDLDTLNLTGQPVLLKTKFRYVDPVFIKNGTPERLSEVDEEFKRTLEDERQANAKGISARLPEEFMLVFR